MPRLLLAAVVLAILAQRASARTRAAPSPIASPGGRIDDDYDEDDGFDLDEDAFLFFADEEETFDAAAAAREEPEQVDVSGGGASGMRSPRSRSGARSRTRWGWTCSATRDGRARRRVEKLQARARVGARTSSAGPDAFCLNVSEPRYYAAPRSARATAPGATAAATTRAGTARRTAGASLKRRTSARRETSATSTKSFRLARGNSPGLCRTGARPGLRGRRNRRNRRGRRGSSQAGEAAAAAGIPVATAPARRSHVYAQPVGQFPGVSSQGVSFPVSSRGNSRASFPVSFPGNSLDSFPGNSLDSFPGNSRDSSSPGVGQQPQNPGQRRKPDRARAFPSVTRACRRPISAFVCCCDLECTSWSRTYRTSRRFPRLLQRLQPGVRASTGSTSSSLELILARQARLACDLPSTALDYSRYGTVRNDGYVADDSHTFTSPGQLGDRTRSETLASETRRGNRSPLAFALCPMIFVSTGAIAGSRGTSTSSNDSVRSASPSPSKSYTTVVSTTHGPPRATAGAVDPRPKLKRRLNASLGPQRIVAKETPVAVRNPHAFFPRAFRAPPRHRC